MPFTYTTRDERKYWVAEMDDLQGLTVFTPGVYINSKYKGRAKFSTYVHEWLHMEFPHWKHERVYDLEESLVDILWTCRKTLCFEDVRMAINIICKNWRKRPRLGLEDQLWTYLCSAGYIRDEP